MHSDTWTGANPNWCAVHLFLLGDIAKNNIRYAEPPKYFSEDWLKPLNKSNDGKKISNEFKIIDYTPKKGSMIIADASIIHQSHRKKNAGVRISLDTGFDLKMNKLKSFKKIKINNYNVKKIRIARQFQKRILFKLVEKLTFIFLIVLKIKFLIKEDLNIHQIQN